MEQKKEQYVQPVVVKHELLRDITAVSYTHLDVYKRQIHHRRFFGLLKS